VAGSDVSWWRLSSLKPAARSETGPRERFDMGVALLILLLALLLGGVGLFVEALRWVLIIAVVLLIISAITGFRGRGARV
jgi:hypothetical protein